MYLMPAYDPGASIYLRAAVDDPCVFLRPNETRSVIEGQSTTISGSYD